MLVFFVEIVLALLPGLVFAMGGGRGAFAPLLGCMRIGVCCMRIGFCSPTLTSLSSSSSSVITIGVLFRVRRWWLNLVAFIWSRSVGLVDVLGCRFSTLGAAATLGTGSTLGTG